MTISSLTNFTVNQNLLQKYLKGVCLIPASGEFIYDTVPVLVNGTSYENLHRTGSANTDMTNSVLALKQAVPGLKTVSLVASWFGTDLRAAYTTIQPGVDSRTKVSSPYNWQVANQTRSTAYLVQSDPQGNAYFGGTPSDLSLVRCAMFLVGQGYGVTFYPFIFNDIEPGNTLPNPYSVSGIGQETQPWRGLITTLKNRVLSNTTDLTSQVTTDVANFFGTCTASQITVSIDPSTNAITYSTTATDWSFRRLILHYAKLCAAINTARPGTITNFLIGSELRELLCLQSFPGVFPAVAAMVTLAADVKAVLGSGVKISYASDWSETTGYSATNGFFFHLDPIWASSSVDFIGIDYYVPLGDDKTGATLHDLAMLQSGVQGGELYDYFYASDTARTAQVRTPITDSIYRIKAIANWWSTQHYNRPGGVPSGTPTSFVPQGKQIVLTEYGAAKIDKTANQPNVFPVPDPAGSLVVQGGTYDAGTLPYFSNGVQDTSSQTQFLIALLQYWNNTSNNLTSNVYSGPMIDLARSCAWCWDARPYPEFPQLKTVWTDYPKFNVGHWLNNSVISFPDLVLPSIPVVGVIAGQSNAEKLQYSEPDNQGVTWPPGQVTLANVLGPLLDLTPDGILLVNIAKGGTALLAAMDYSTAEGGELTGHWINTDGTPGPLAVAGVTKYFTQTTKAPAFIIWDQGETDWGTVLKPGSYSGSAGGGYRTPYPWGMLGNGCTQAQYNTAFAQLVAYWRSPAGFNVPNLPVLISGIGKGFYPWESLVATGVAAVPSKYGLQEAIWSCQRTAINTISNVFQGPRRARVNGDYGPEWSQDPELNFVDGIHLVGGPTGYGLHATRLAYALAPIINGTLTWTANSYKFDGPDNELVIFGENSASGMNVVYFWIITSLVRSGNVVTATVNPGHGFDTSTEIGLVVFVTGAVNTSFNGTFTLTGTPSTTTMTWAQTAANASTTGGFITAKSGAQTMRDIIVAYQGWTNSQLGITDLTEAGSCLDYDSDILTLAEPGNDYYTGKGLYRFGRWWNPDTNGPDLLGACLGDYLEQRGTEIKGLVWSGGEKEFFVKDLTYTDPVEGHGTIVHYSIATEYIPRLTALFAYLRSRNGNSNLPIYMIQAGGVVFEGTYFPFTVIQTANNTLAATLNNVYIAAYPSGDPGGGANVGYAPDGYDVNAIGLQTIGTRLGNFIKAYITTGGPPAPPAFTGPVVVRSSNIANVTNQTNWTASAGFNCTGGSLLLVYVHGIVGAVDTGVTAKLAGVNMTLLATANDSSQQQIWVYYALSPAQTTNTIAVTSTGSIFAAGIEVHAVLISGTSGSPIGPSNSAFASGAGTATITTSTTMTLLLGFAGQWYASVTPSVTSGFVNLTDVETNSASGSSTYYFKQYTAGAQPFTVTPGYNKSSSFVVAIK